MIIRCVDCLIFIVFCFYWFVLEQVKSRWIERKLLMCVDFWLVIYFFGVGVCCWMVMDVMWWLIRLKRFCSLVVCLGVLLLLKSICVSVVLWVLCGNCRWFWYIFWYISQVWCSLLLGSGWIMCLQICQNWYLFCKLIVGVMESVGWGCCGLLMLNNLVGGVCCVMLIE